MNIDDQGNDLPADLGAGNVLRDISAAVPPSASVEKTPASSSASTEKVSAEKAVAEKAPAVVDSEEEDENEHFVPMPDFGGYIPADNPEYSMEYAQNLLHRIDDDDFTADVTADHFHRYHDEKIRIGPAQIQVHSHVYSLAKRLIKAYPDMYSKLKHGSSLIGSALHLLCFALQDMEDTPLSSVTEALILKWSGPIKAARQLGMQVDFASAHLRTVTEAYLGSLALAAAPPLDVSLLKSEIEKKEQAIATIQ
ncbi:snRNA-activating protein complex subunit 4 [Corchorus capsularis]|uniref:snRNA-activating protein complex subunit 4 n=1 Tax=Corchorus capsularis TaxID=210143 RepID=A0A1R3JSM2_COCAP|nr:snRNA-activating protein complex subunit 4 [Corchorus capsularis]